MEKETLHNIIDKYREAENIITELDGTFGITLWNSKNENFYNKYNYVIFKLFEELFGEKKREILEEYIFEQNDMTFDELFKYLNE